MASILTTADAWALRDAAPSRWRAHVLRWAIFFVGCAATVITVNAQPDVPCTEARPCGPEPVNVIALGLFVGSWLILGWSTPRLAALAAAVVAVAGPLWDQFHPADASLVAELSLIAYALVTILLAWLRTRRSPSPAEREFADRTPRGNLTAVRLTPRRGRIRIGLGLALLLVGAAVSTAGVLRQSTMDARQAAARTESAAITAVDATGYTVTVADPTRVIDVVSPASYRVGGEIRLRVDDGGLAQPLAEPYDATPWQLLAVLLALGALALITTGYAVRSRRMLSGAYPMTEAYYQDGNLYAGDALAGAEPLARLDLGEEALVRDGQPHREDMGGLATPSRWQDQRITLYGVPAPGATVIVGIAGGPVVATARVRPPSGLGRFRPVAGGDHGTGPAPDQPRGALPGQVAALVPAAELTAAPEQVFRYRKPALIGYALSACLPLALVELVRRLPTTPAFVLSVLLTLASFAAGYRIWLRPAAAWNGGGIAARGVLGSVRSSWADVTSVSTQDDSVVVVAGPAAVLLPAQARRGGRTAASLTAGLLHARSRYADRVDPPPAPPMRLPVFFLLLFPVPVAILMAMQAVSH
ncbi:hypothetical protein [Hamadaea tsunoensis]|uniref:hypothetical protein n=1 Tax=Hamadaea tsunoensis TaxID=53368 RepID=UPI000484C51E|nr:hypothetical protein [Hamadaea tsunoensis]